MGVLLRGLVSICRQMDRQSLVSSLWGPTGGCRRKNNLETKTRCRYYSKGLSEMKVTICGAGGATGQPLALLLKQCPAIDELALYDKVPICGFGVELSHVDTRPKVTSFSGCHMLADALKGAQVVVIVVRDERGDSFELNAPIVTQIALQICNCCPTAFTVVGTEPIMSITPLVGEIQRLRNVYNPRHLLGCVELNCVRANTVVADFLRVPPEYVTIPVVGGSTPDTMVPVISAAVHPGTMSQEQVECVTSCIMSGTEAVVASKGGGIATPSLAGAYSLARTVCKVVKGLKGITSTQCAYHDTQGYVVPSCQFFSSDVILGPSGVTSSVGIPELSKFENCLLMNALPTIRNEQARAEWLVYSMCSSCCSPCCVCHPETCYESPCVPCCPPVNWTCDCPDATRDEYLASICRDMTCMCGSCKLCWRPREADYNAARANKFGDQLPNRGGPCAIFEVPRSVAIQQEHINKQKSRTPC